eukprot:6188027-Pleurochrysis_carterae.AAC.2
MKVGSSAAAQCEWDTAFRASPKHWQQENKGKGKWAKQREAASRVRAPTAHVMNPCMEHANTQHGYTAYLHSDLVACRNIQTRVAQSFPRQTFLLKRRIRGHTLKRRVRGWNDARTHPSPRRALRPSRQRPLAFRVRSSNGACAVGSSTACSPSSPAPSQRPHGPPQALPSAGRREAVEK